MAVRQNRFKMPAAWLMGIALVLACFAPDALAAPKPAKRSPNILFFILDDVGIDQMESFGYGGTTPPQLPGIDAIANAGVSFRNMWAQPECSPSRALVFEGRYPLRTHVTDAILSVDLANSQVSPYETTIPRILRQRGYQSGLFGKFHLTGSNVNATGAANNPLGYTAVYQLGWDFFAGWQDGAPHPIDSTAGGVAPTGVNYACGFVPNSESANGADSGACYFVDDSCTEISTAQAPTPGRACIEQGGIFDPGAVCQAEVPANIDFTLQNGYYAGELVLNQPDGSYTVLSPEDPSGAARGYRSMIESDWAIEWINSRPTNTPWMATVSFSSAHTPYQQPPTSLLPPGSLPTDDFNCLTDVPDQRVLSNQMIESMDAEIARVLVETGIATLNDGMLEFDPEHSNTMIVILGDNGTYAPVVKLPFNLERAKGTVYQTGVWAPLIVAGPLVKAPGRDVGAMVNIADVFQLFGEIAGIDVHKVVPRSRPLDSVAMLPYLENPHQKSLRKTNFAMAASNIKAEGYEVPPCVIAAVNTCVQLFPSQQLCTSEGGIWWGEADGSDPPLPIADGAPQVDCCGVNEYRLANAQQSYGVLPDWQLAMRDDRFKLLEQATTDWATSTGTGACVTTQTTEFYAINEQVPPKLDNAPGNLLMPPHKLLPAEKVALNSLTKALNQLLDSAVPCTGDGNLDGVIDQQDIEQWDDWVAVTGSLSSWYDFNLDGLTNGDDVPYMTQGTFPRKCPKSK